MIALPSSLRGRDPWKNHPQIRPYDSYSSKRRCSLIYLRQKQCIIHSHYIIPLRELVLHHFTLQNTILYTLYTILDPLLYIIINYICIHIYKLYNKQHVTYVTMCIVYALLHNYKYTIVWYAILFESNPIYAILFTIHFCEKWLIIYVRLIHI